MIILSPTLSKEWVLINLMHQECTCQLFHYSNQYSITQKWFLPWNICKANFLAQEAYEVTYEINEYVGEFPAKKK